MVNLFPLAFIAVATIEVLGDAHQSCLFGEWIQGGFLMRSVVKVAHHNDAGLGALMSNRIYSLAHILHYTLS